MLSAKKMLAVALCAVGLAAGAESSETQEAIEAAFDAEHTGTSVEPVYDADGVLAGHTVILGTNYASGVKIPTDVGAVTLDLNGWVISGTNGVDGTTTTAGAAGGPAIVIAGACGADAGDTAITVTNVVPAGQLWVGGPIWAESNLGD